MKPQGIVILFASLLAVAPVRAQELPPAPLHAADGVTINAEGQPQYSTFSLCAIDPATGQSGASVTTRVPFVGRAVPHVRAGVGAVCTQASTVVEYGPRGLDLLAKGVEPTEVLAQLLADDEQRESRQVGVIDLHGRSAAHTGKNNGNWAGSRQGKNYTVQANIMVGPEVVDAVATTFESTEGTGIPLAERMILAMEAGYAKGGDRRWGNLQSAAIKIADPHDPGRGGDYIALAIEVGEHPEPVAEMKRIYETTGRHLGYRSFSRIEGADVIELKRMLHAVGYWRPSLAAFPDPPAPTTTLALQELRRTNPAEYDKALAQARAASAAYARDYAQFDAEAIAAVDSFRRDHGLDYQGDAPGLVDARLTAALRTAYINQTKSGEKPLVTASTHASGPFDVKLNPLPSSDKTPGANLGRMSIEKQYHGELQATGKGEMLTATGLVKDSGAYVAVERVSGTLHGRRGTFALQHSGTMTRGATRLTVTVVPDSGTDELVGLAGTMTIVIADGKHSYEFDYTLSGSR
jgi:uncharacterized Ntn-hydrolase superfamily protein